MKISKGITGSELSQLDFRFHYSESELFDDWQKLVKTSDYKTGSQFKPGLKLCQHFFPNFWEIENNQGKSFAKLWHDEDFMQGVIDWGNRSMSNLWMSWIRRAVYMRGGLANSSMYRPHLSRMIIENYLGVSSGHVFDPCAGWGGRMLGVLSKGWSYEACEPNPITHDGLERMIFFLKKHGYDVNAQIHDTPVEDFTNQREVDLIITSPPYFNLEIYLKDGRQCYTKYEKYENWLDGWLIPLLKSTTDSLKAGGVAAWNVMNIGKQKTADSACAFLEKSCVFVDAVGMNSPMANLRKTRKAQDLTYVFKKQV